MKIYLLCLLTAFTISLAFCWLLIPILRRLKAGQNILSYVKEHKKKGGTPTMGGLAFVCAATFTALLFQRQADRTFLLTLAIGLSYLFVGFLDDLMKMKRKENLGLKAWQKLIFQTLIALFAAIYCIRTGLTTVYLPFLRHEMSIGWWMLPLSLVAFIGTVNAVNLTDGLDGLAAGASVPFFAALGVLLLIQKGNENLAMLSFCLVGALLAYLIFNVSPASIFMGDTGSLSIGGFAAAVGVFSGNVFYLLILGAVFVFSVITVMLQVIYYKATKGKRIFLMAPIHHHFQMKGYAESKIAYAYFVITVILGILCVVTAL